MQKTTIALVATLAIATVLMIGIAGVAAADDGDEGNESETSIVVEIDDDTRVTDVEWHDDHAEVEIEASGSSRVSIVDISPIDSQGAHQVDEETVRLRDESATVEVTLAKPSNPQLSISTNEGVALLVGDGEGFNPFAGVGATWGLVRLAALGAALGGAGAIGIIGWSAVADRHDSEELMQP